MTGTSFTPVTEIPAGLADLAGRARRRRARRAPPAYSCRAPAPAHAQPPAAHNAPAQTAPLAPSRARPHPRAENARGGGRAAPGTGHLGGLVARGPQREVVTEQLKDLRRLLVLRRVELRACASAARPRTRWGAAGDVCVRVCVGGGGDVPPRDRRSRLRKPSCSQSTPPRRPPGSRRRKPAAQTVPPSAASRLPLPTRRGAGARRARAWGTGVAHRLVEGEAEAEG